VKVHKILKGEGAERFLPFALSKLRFLIGSSQSIRVQSYRVDDAEIRIEMNPTTEQHFVRIEALGGSLGYEFFTTYDEIGKYSGTAWWATSVRPNVAEPGLKVGKLSTSFGNPSPPLVPRDPMARAINLQRNAEYHWWPAKEGVKATDAVRTKPYFMTSTLGVQSWQGNTRDFQSYLSSFSLVRDSIARIYEFGNDVSVDVPPTLYEKGAAKAALPYPTMPDWPRRSAVMEVGGRRFIIMSDMHSNFRAFPESYLSSSPSAYLFHPTRVKIARPADYMPAGVARPSMETMTPAARGLILPSAGGWHVPAEDPAPVPHPYSEFPDAPVEPGADERRQYQLHHYLWDFHPSGSRAVAVVHTNKNKGHDTLTVSNGLTQEPVTVLAEYGPQYRIGADHATDEWVINAGGATTIGVCERAVLEVDFHITLTGEGEDDFTFSVSTRRLMANYWFFDAQYAYSDPRLEARGVFGGDLLTDEIRLRGKPPGDRAEVTVWDAFIVTRNQDHIADVASYCVAKNRPFYVYEAFRSVRTSLGTYPGIPPLIYRWFLVDVPPVGDYGLARMVASDLRSMSKVFNQSRNGIASPLHAVVFGETRKGAALARTEAQSAFEGLSTIPPGFIAPGSAWAVGNWPADDIGSSNCLALHRLVWDQCVNGYGFDISVSTSMATHPDGHFAVFCHHYDALDVFDLIEYRRVVDGVESFDRTTHVEAWTKVFGTSFDPASYAEKVVSDKPLVIQRFASWRNIKLPALAASADLTMNQRLKDPK